MKKLIYLSLILFHAVILSAQTNLLTQGFETLPFPPAGWSNVRITGPSFPGNWSRIGNGTAPIQTPHTGGFQIRFNSHNYTAGTSGDLRTSVLNFTAAGNYTVSFWMYRDAYAANDKLEVFVNTLQTSVGGTLLGTINRDKSQSPVVASNGWYKYTFTISPAFNTATNFIIFKGSSALGNDIYVDDISVDRTEPAIPNCVGTISPANGSTGLCVNQTLNWDNVALASGYKMTIGSNNPDYNNIANNADLGVALGYSAALNPTTIYGWKITPYNGFGEAAGCPINTFSTGTSTCYCIPVYLDNSCASEDYINNFSTTLGITNITNTASGCSVNANNYTYFTAQSITTSQGGNFNVSMQSGPDYAQGYAIWIDWNIDGDFEDAGEYAFYSPFATVAVVNGNINVPFTATTGATRMRVRSAYNYVPGAANACTTFTDGETEDYNIQVNACASTITYYADADLDGYGNIASSITLCTGVTAPAGYVLNNTDCNDANNLINPTASEICNGIDDNCNAISDDGLIFVNYYTDADADSYGSNSASPINSCNPIAGSVNNNSDCNDANNLINPSATEICNAIDDNCNATIDEGLIFVNYYTDADADSYGSNIVSPVNSCSAIVGKVTNNSDCNDANFAIKPGATEICNGIDDNCNASIDEGLIFANYYTDGDADSYGSSIASPVNSCSPIAGKVTNNTDCNDANFAIKPGATEICNGIDDNCNASIDEGVVSATITPSGPTTFCKGSNVILSANTGGGYTYIWNKNGAAIAGATGANYTATLSGNYTVKVTVAGGCFAVSAITVVSVSASPTASISTPDGTDLCGKVNVRLKANNGTGYIYQWFKGAAPLVGETGLIYYATATGNYKVNVTNALGCSKLSAAKSISKTCREEEIIASENLHIFPNPASSVLFIESTINPEIKSGSMYLINMLGEQIYFREFAIENGVISEQLNIDYTVPAGLYFVKLLVAEKEFTRQIVIQK